MNKNPLGKKLENINYMELIFLSSLLLLSSYMFLESFSFEGSAARFPRYMSILTITAIVLTLISILFADYLPKLYIESFFKESSIMSTDSEEETNFKRSSGSDDGSFDKKYRVSPIAFTLIAILSYMATSYLISFLFATPLFVASYLYWFKKPWYHVLLLSILSVIIIYLFMEFLYVPLDEGILLFVI